MPRKKTAEPHGVETYRIRGREWTLDKLRAAGIIQDGLTTAKHKKNTSVLEKTKEGTPQRKEGLLPAKITIPPWVPEAVREWTLNHEEEDEERKQVQRRLLTGKRMRRVWRELTRKKRVDYRPTGEFFHQRNSDEPSHPSFDKALVAFFFWSYTAVGLLPTMTKDEAAELSDLESRGLVSIGPLNRGFMVVHRYTARDNVRSYVLVLAKACKALFNSPLYSTIATTASVALNIKVTPSYVRQVIRRHLR